MSVALIPFFQNYCNKLNLPTILRNQVLTKLTEQLKKRLPIMIETAQRFQAIVF